MDYEKAYKEALERAKSFQEKYGGDYAGYIFPELRESEDERIRKFLITIVNNLCAPNFKDVEKKEVIAWLEKQKTHKPTDEDEEIRGKILQHFRNTLILGCGNASSSDVKRWIAYLEKQKDASKAIEAVDRIDKYIDEHLANAHDMKDSNPDKKYYRGWDDALGKMAGILQDVYSNEKQKEQKPVEWSEDYREEDIQTRFAFYTYKDDPSVLYLSNVFVEESSRNHGFGTRILKAAEKAAEAVGATTISLKVKQDSPANAWYRKNGYGYVAFEDGYDWLEKNLEYMKPVKQQWSEEDETYLQDALWCVKQAVKVAKTENDVGTCWSAESWLKSLRPSWKPSEEQMKHLERCFSHGHTVGLPNQHVLESLYNDLKKL